MKTVFLFFLNSANLCASGFALFRCSYQQSFDPLKQCKRPLESLLIFNVDLVIVVIFRYLEGRNK